MPKKKPAKIGRKVRRTKAAKEKAKAELAENLEAKPDQITHDHRYSGPQNLQCRTLPSTSPQNVQPRTPPPTSPQNLQPRTPLPTSPQNLQTRTPPLTSPQNLQPRTSPSTSIQNLASPLASGINTCRHIGKFVGCACIVHEDVNQTSDLDDLNADEHFLILGTSVQKYQPEEDFGHMHFQLLKEDVLKHERLLTEQNMNLIRTTQKLHVCQFYEHNSVKVKLTVSVDIELNPTITVHGKLVPVKHPVFKNMTKVCNFTELNVLLHSLQDYAVCRGNPDEEFVAQFGFKGKSFLENDCGADYEATIRADSCSLLTQSLRCKECIATQGVLNSKKNRLKNSKKTPLQTDEIVSSSKPHSAMSRAELEEKMRHLKAKCKKLELQCKRLQIRLELAKEKYKAATEEEAVELQELVTQTTSKVEELFPDPNSFQRIFWEEQVKYNDLREKSAMRWHPLIVKWALHIRSKSSESYEAMRESGFINLPSERTLYNYSHCIASELGFQPEALDLLIKECEHRSMFDEDHPWKNYVGLLQDEIKVIHGRTM